MIISQHPIDPLRGCTWKRRNLEGFGKGPYVLSVATLLAQLGQTYRDGSYLDFMRVLPHLKKALGTREYPALKKGMAEYCRCALDCAVREDVPIRLWLQLLEQRAEQLITESPRLDQHDLVRQVITFVDANYPSDIAVGQIAEQLRITPNYLSAAFHKRTGTTFMKYLTKARLLKAKELLLDTTLPVQKVAEQIGYANTRYFAKLFRPLQRKEPSRIE